MMESDPRGERRTVESEFAATVKYADLYLRQKTDLFLQHYVFEPIDAIGLKLMFLSIVITLFVAGTLVLLAGVILLLATRLPLYAAFLIAGIAIFLAGAVIARVFFLKETILRTPTATEIMDHGKKKTHN